MGVCTRQTGLRLSHSATPRILLRLTTIFLNVLIVSSKLIQQAEEVGGEKTCSLYLAESSIQNAGWGVFAARDYELGERLEEAGLGIQIIDPTKSNKNIRFLMEILWRSVSVGGYNEADDVRTFLPGLGSLVNYNPLMSNVIEGGLWHDPLFERSQDPEAGSVTAYHNFSFVALRKIRAGEEIFIAEENRGDKETWSEVPSKADFDRASSIVDGLLGLLEDSPGLTPVQWIDVLYRLKNEILVEGAKISDLLPDTLDELLKIRELGFARAPLIERDLAWVKKNGWCLDNIQEGMSTIPAAGRGAFARRSIAEGALIAPAPLIPITYPFEASNPKSSTATLQLLENYCFGHEKSDLRLCPLTQVVLINHHNEPNAILRWTKTSKNKFDASPNFLVGSVGDLLHLANQRPLLSPLTLEVVALKDIAKGEEIFIDYGLLWEHAYENHVKSWEKPEDVENLNTETTHQCQMEPRALEQPGHIVEEDVRGRPWLDIETWDLDSKKIYGENPQTLWYPCQIVGDGSTSGTFRTSVFSKFADTPHLIRRFHNFPPDAMRSVESPYTSDQHLPLAFRHFVPLGDGLFPLHWRSDYQEARDVSLGVIDKGVDAKKKRNRAVVEQHEQVLRDAKCGLYFAPSNIPEAGFSSYTAVPYAGSGITIASPMVTIIIPLVLEAGQNSWILKDYVWNAVSYQAEFETFGHEEANAMSVSLANFHPGIVNMKVDTSVYLPTLDRCKDPGAGAFSDYQGAAFISVHTLEAGDELFVSYGDIWFLARPQFADIALGKNYDEANSVVASLSSMLSQRSVDEEIGEKLLETIRSSVVSSPRTIKALSTIQNVDDIRRVIERNGTAQAEMERRTPEWFDEHGQCMDHIFLKASSIPQAGIGAFARRPLKKGTAIISSPMIAIWGRHMMNIDMKNAPPGVNPTLLLLNYMLSHPRSSVFFLPINQLMGINHASNRSGKGPLPNGELRWSTWNKKSSYYLQRPLEDLQLERFSTIVIEVVATRDIAPDEEVLIDYGVEWEDAWYHHLQKWVPPCKPNQLSPWMVRSMNDDKMKEEYHEWSEDHFIVCVPNETRLRDVIYIVEEKSPNGSLKDDHADAVLEEFEGIRWNHEGFTFVQTASERSPCVIIESFPEDETFTAALFSNKEGVRKLRIYEGLHESFMNYLPKPWKSDMHWSGAFRHEIKIPDSIFPQHWMDLE